MYKYSSKTSMTHNIDGFFTMADSNFYLNPQEIFPIAKKTNI